MLWTPLFFDALILLGIIPAGLLAYFLLRDRRDRTFWAGRHRTASLVLALSCAAMASGIFYGSFIEPHIIVTNHEQLDLATVDAPIRIAIISDIQVGPYLRDEFVRRVVRKVDAAAPDFILYPGDFVQNDGTQTTDESQFLRPLGELAQKYPFFAVAGNHEHGVGNRQISPEHTGSVVLQLTRTLTDIGVRLLSNRMVTTTVRGQVVAIYGVDDMWADADSFHRFAPVATGTPTILVSHNPDLLFKFIPYASSMGIDPRTLSLVVSGHTHGGQVRLPFLGAIGNAYTDLPAQWYRGFSSWGGIPLYVTSGLGESGPRARLFTLPEVVVLDLY